MRTSGFSATALSLISMAATGSAYWRMPCPGRIATERLDPIVSPGAVSGHVHTISGGNGFKPTMDYADARASECSSCPIKQDLSNYWTPKLYYQSENGSFIDVPQAGDGVGVYGGMTVYYLQRGGPNNDNLTAFPENFRMLAGDPFKRAYTDDFAGQAISFVCLDYSGTSNYYNEFPDKVCPDGLRAQVFFPSCWDGVNLDSSDHKSHMAYPTKYSYDNGPCPASHPVHMISIFYEVIYSTADFEWWNGTQQPFVFAQGDPTGYGFHGDFINGWDVDALQNATDNCNADSGLITDCPVFDFFTDDECEACIVAPVVQETVTGTLDKLPGCNAVTWGPDEAPTTEAGCTSTTVIGAAPVYYTNVTGWDYVGCGADSTSSRTFTNSSWLSDTMTVERCLAYCKNQGLHYAGIEYASQCYCGDSLPASRAPTAGVLGNCFTPCAGNSSEVCGGSNRLSIYHTDTVSATVSCPSGNNTNYTSNNATFLVGCGGDYTGSDLSMVSVSNGIQGCIDACSTTAGCKGVSLSGTACYMKSSVSTLSTSSGVNAAKLLSGGVPAVSSTSSSKSSSSTSSSSTSTASITTATDAAGSNYTLYWSSDSGQGSYTNTAASSSYTDCMTACDADSKCTAFTYVGGSKGVGSGTCWLKTVLGSPVPSSSNVVSGSRNSKGSNSASSSSSSTVSSTSSSSSSSVAKVATAAFSSATGNTVVVASSTSSAASTTTSYASSTTAACPASNNTLFTDSATNATFLIECGIDHSGGDLVMVGVSTFADCIAACANTTGCVDVSLSAYACYLKKSVGTVVYSSGIKGAKLYANGTISSTSTSASATATVANKVAAVSSSKTTSSSSTSTSSSKTSSSSSASTSSSKTSSSSSTSTSSSKTSSTSSKVTSTSTSASSSKVSSSSSTKTTTLATVKRVVAQSSSSSSKKSSTSTKKTSTSTKKSSTSTKKSSTSTKKTSTSTKKTTSTKATATTK